MLIRAKLRLAAVAVCALALAFMALASTSAKAEAGAAWLIEDKFGKFFNASTLKATVVSNGIEGGLGSLLTKVLGMGVKISCTAFELVGVKLEGEGSVTKGSKSSFTGCTTSLNGSVNPGCKPSSPGSALGTIITNEGKGLLVLHKGEGLTRFEPSSGETLATINMGEECPIGETLPMRGKITLQDVLIELATVVHFINQGPLTDMWVLNKTAEHSATIDGTGLVKLGGEHAGRPWRGSPG